MDIQKNHRPLLTGVLALCLVLCSCGGVALSRRQIVRGVFFQQQPGCYTACLVLADADSEDPAACKVASATAETAAAALSAAEASLPGPAFYGLLELAVLPYGAEWPQARALGRLLYDRARPAPEVSVFLAGAPVTDWDTEAPALLEDLRATQQQLQVHFGLQQLFTDDHACLVPVARTGGGYDVRLLAADGRGVTYSGMLPAQLAAVLAGHAKALQGTYGGSYAMAADAEVLNTGTELLLYLHSARLQSLGRAGDTDAHAALQSAMQAAYSRLWADVSALGADPYHFAFWQQCAGKITGAAAVPQPPRLTLVM